MRRVLEIAAIALGGAVVLAMLSFYGWTRISRYPASDDAASLAAAAQTDDGWLVLKPDSNAMAGLVFYPGGLVDPAAYAPLMKRVSDSGVLAIIVPMPLDLAIFGIGRADDVIAAYPEVARWTIGGHSLGGAMACQYISSYPEVFDGLVLLGAYPAESTDLSALDMPTALIYGTEDGVSGDIFKAVLARLPADTELVEIVGGNHAQFGDYGPQQGDGNATISREQQQRATAKAILEVVGRMDRL